MKKYLCNQITFLVLLGLSPSCSPDETNDPSGHGSTGNDPAAEGLGGNASGGTNSAGGAVQTGGRSGCVVDNLVCTESAQCCSGYCNMENGTNGSCRPDPAGIGNSGKCYEYDSNCLFTEECCEGSCTLGFCSRYDGCRILGASCTGRDVCCAGLVCQNRLCVSEASVATGGASSVGGATGTGGMAITCIPGGQSCAGSLSNACCTGLTCVNSICTSAT